MKPIEVKNGVHHVNSGLVIASGTAHIEASGSATVILFEQATARAGGQAHCTAMGESKVILLENAEAVMHKRSQLEAYDATTWTALDDSSVTASDTSNGFVGHRAVFHGKGAAKAYSMSSGDFTIEGDAVLEVVQNGKLVVYP
ncbi:hypothetical protein BH11CYA1_BH11CYA1_07930 [soil metagenome]